MRRGQAGKRALRLRIPAPAATHHRETACHATDPGAFSSLLPGSGLHCAAIRPGVVVRGGTSPEGLPIGIQVVVAPSREDVALAVAERLETTLGGWKPPQI